MLDFVHRFLPNLVNPLNLVSHGTCEVLVVLLCCALQHISALVTTLESSKVTTGSHPGSLSLKSRGQVEGQVEVMWFNAKYVG
jgi:hypothetical protein